MFSEGIYGPTLCGFLWGPLLVIPFYLLSRRFPTSWVSSIHVPVLLSGALYLAPYNFSYLWTGMPIAWFFNSFVKKRFPAWWSKYALTMTTAFSVGLSLSALVIFFAVSYRPVTLDWWGNDVCEYMFSVVLFLFLWKIFFFGTALENVEKCTDICQLMPATTVVASAHVRSSLFQQRVTSRRWTGRHSLEPSDDKGSILSVDMMIPFHLM